jgi:hypothetical protein
MIHVYNLSSGKDNYRARRLVTFPAEATRPADLIVVDQGGIENGFVVVAIELLATEASTGREATGGIGEFFW